MFTVEINGKEYASEKDWALLDFLREELHILSAKDGCHEGACGTCTVIIDNRAVRACVQKLSKLAGKKIQTIEGFTEREREVFAYAFSEAGSVQCGFCIPGMVVCGKCLIDNNPDPTREEVKNAIKNNICRCTGYQKIEDGILLAARMLRENIPVPGEKEKAGVGRKIHRVDARDKTLGEAKYAADYFVEGMRKIMPPALAIFFSSMVFGIWHMEPIQVVYTIIAGIAFGVVYYRTRKLRYPILMHIINNFTSALPPQWDTQEVNDSIFHISLLCILPAIILLIGMARKEAPFPKRLQRAFTEVSAAPPHPPVPSPNWYKSE